MGFAMMPGKIRVEEHAAPSLVDPFGRRIYYLRISVTDRCNLRCVYCLPERGVRWLPRDEILSFEEVRAVVGVAARLGISHVRITGGEPLVRRDLPQLISMLAEIPDLADLALTTNGILLAQHARALARAGLKRINISLDTLDATRFREVTRFGSISDVFAGLDAALEAGLEPLKLNVVVVRGVNDDEIPTLAKLSTERPLHVRFIEFMPIGGYFSREKLVPAAEIMSRVQEIGPLEPAETPRGCGPARTFRYPGACGTVGLIAAVTRSFCAQCNRLRLTATGQLRPCLDDQAAESLLPALRPEPNFEKLAELIRLTVARKPEHHTMAERDAGDPRFCMSGVGG